MSLESCYNDRSPAVKRLMREAAELMAETEYYNAAPLDENLFEWHFTVRGAEGSDFEGGIYHGRLLFPNEYPMKPPDIMLFTPNGRFEVNTKICLSISGHHPETWLPSWSVRTALVALIAFMPAPSNGTIGSVDYSSEERQILAKKSRTWKCPNCGVVSELLSDSGNLSASSSSLTDSSHTEEETSDTENSDATVPDSDSDETDTEFEAVSNNDESCEENICDLESSLENGALRYFQGFSLLDTVIISIIILVIAFLVYRRMYIL